MDWTYNAKAVPTCTRGRETQAGVVELVDTLALGASGRKPLGVRVPSPALMPSEPDPMLCVGAGARVARQRGYPPRGEVSRAIFQPAFSGARK